MSKKKPIPKAIKILVWNKYIGEIHGNGLCQCCKKQTISQMSFHCGHIISEFNGGGITVNNLKPICANCNLSMGTRNMDEFIATHGLHEDDDKVVNVVGPKKKNVRRNTANKDTKKKNVTENNKNTKAENEIVKNKRKIPIKVDNKAKVAESSSISDSSTISVSSDDDNKNNDYSTLPSYIKAIGNMSPPPTFQNKKLEKSYEKVQKKIDSDPDHAYKYKLDWINEETKKQDKEMWEKCKAKLENSANEYFNNGCKW